MSEVCWVTTPACKVCAELLKKATPAELTEICRQYEKLQKCKDCQRLTDARLRAGRYAVRCGSSLHD